MDRLTRHGSPADDILDLPIPIPGADLFKGKNVLVV
jgi:hypothetical protein